MTIPRACRQALLRDQNYIVGNWLASFRTSHAAGPIRMSRYHDVYEPEIHALIARPGVKCWVAFNPEESDQEHDLYGFLCLEWGAMVPQRNTEEMVPVGTPVVHYVYVNQIHRKLGMVRAMAKAAGFAAEQGFTYTYKTGIGTQVADGFHAPACPRGKDRRQKCADLSACSRFNPLLPRFPRTA